MILALEFSPSRLQRLFDAWALAVDEVKSRCMIRGASELRSRKAECPSFLFEQRQHRPQTVSVTHCNQHNGALAGKGSYRGGNPLGTEEWLVTRTLLAKLAPFVPNPIQQFDGSTFTSRRQALQTPVEAGRVRRLHIGIIKGSDLLRQGVLLSKDDGAGIA
jgi:hypothetical protein